MSQDRDIEDYIRQNRTTYTRQAITDSLLAKGHNQQEIDRIWESIEKRFGRSQKGNGISLGSIVGVAVLWIACSACGLFLLDSLSHPIQLMWAGSSPGPNPVTVRTINLLFVATEGGALIGALLLLRRGMRIWQGVGVVIAVNFTWLIIILGACFSGGLR